MPVGAYRQNDDDTLPEKFRRYGTITRLSPVNAIIRCDVLSYFNVFVPARADHKMRRLDKEYSLNERVSFFPKRAEKPEKGCDFVAYKMTKVLADGTPEPLQQNVSGIVDFVSDDYGFIRYQSGTRAFFHFENCAADGIVRRKLKEKFPVRSSVLFDLHCQPPKSGCEYRATNMRLKSTAVQSDSVNRESRDREKVSPRRRSKSAAASPSRQFRPPLLSNDSYNTMDKKTPTAAATACDVAGQNSDGVAGDLLLPTRRPKPNPPACLSRGRFLSRSRASQMTLRGAAVAAATATMTAAAPASECNKSSSNNDEDVEALRSSMESLSTTANDDNMSESARPARRHRLSGGRRGRGFGRAAAAAHRRGSRGATTSNFSSDGEFDRTSVKSAESCPVIRHVNPAKSSINTGQISSGPSVIGQLSSDAQPNIETSPSSASHGAVLSSFKDAECQTERVAEMEAVRTILFDDQIMQVVCQKYLKEFKILMESKLK